MLGTPVLEIKLREMKHALMQHLDTYGDEWKEMVSQALEAELKPELIAGKINEEVRAILAESLQHAVKSAVREEVENIVRDRLRVLVSTQTNEFMDRFERALDQVGKKR